MFQKAICKQKACLYRSLTSNTRALDYYSLFYPDRLVRILFLCFSVSKNVVATSPTQATTTVLMTLIKQMWIFSKHFWYDSILYSMWVNVLWWYNQQTCMFMCILVYIQYKYNISISWKPRERRPVFTARAKILVSGVNNMQWTFFWVTDWLTDLSGAYFLQRNSRNWKIPMPLDSLTVFRCTQVFLRK